MAAVAARLQAVAQMLFSLIDDAKIKALFHKKSSLCSRQSPVNKENKK